MSKKKKPVAQKATPKPQAKKAAPKAAPQTAVLSQEAMQKASFAFRKENYRFMIIGLALIAAGFLIMAMDGEEHGFGFLGLTLGPVVTFGGFMFEIFAILYDGKKQEV